MGLLTNHGEQQQDTTDDNGHDDGGLTAPQLQRGDGLVEVPYLDLHRGGGRGLYLPWTYALALLLASCAVLSKAPNLSEPQMPQL